MDEIRPSSFSINSNYQHSLISCSLQKKIKSKHYDYGESCGFYNNSNVFRKKDELKGVRNSFRTPFLSFLGARPRLEPVQRYRYYEQIRKDS